MMMLYSEFCDTIINIDINFNVTNICFSHLSI